jgi:hypothetical protein
MKLISTPTGALVWTQPARSHGIAGNCYFDGTMTFDDPAVADEAIVPLYTDQQYPPQGSTISGNRINAAFARLLTPTRRSRSIAAGFTGDSTARATK